ncbi:DUF1707 domain-containing protein [Kitasatospora sp. NPDC094016]|uniref:DUF1707 SHOCT-like domain-containing protein n=1 Tax=unclassified Kitasatospora TaxID=2633591 RepID=UPI00331849D1
MDNSPSQDDPGQPSVPAPVPMTKPETRPEPQPQLRPLPEPKTQPPHAPVAQAEMRVSDADRERIAELLRDAYAEGRLDADEHADRIGAAYAAKTFGDLVPLTRDLPGHRPLSFEKPPLEAPAPRAVTPALPPARQESPSMVAIFGGSSRKGRWRVGSHLKAFAAFGGVEIDLTDAVFESPEVEIEVTALFGGVEIRVPENVSLHGGGVGIFGGFDVKEQTAADPYAPVVRVKGVAVFGGCEAKPRRGKKLKEWVRKQLGTE